MARCYACGKDQGRGGIVTEDGRLLCPICNDWEVKQGRELPRLHPEAEEPPIKLTLDTDNKQETKETNRSSLSKEDYINFRCGNCSNKIRVQKTKAGKRGKCPKCGSAVVAPEANQTDGAPDGQVSTIAQKTPNSEPREKPLSWEAFRSTHFCAIQNAYRKILREYYKKTNDKNFYDCIVGFIALVDHYKNNPDDAHLRLMGMYFEIANYIKMYDNGSLLDALRSKDPELLEDLKALALLGRLAMEFRKKNPPTSQGEKELQAFYRRLDAHLLTLQQIQ